MPSADKEKAEIGPALEHRSTVQQRFDFVSPAQIAGIAHDEPVQQAPGPTQRIVVGRDRRNQMITNPVGDGRHALVRKPQVPKALRHEIANCHIHGGPAEGGIAQRSRGVAKRAVQPGHAEILGDLGVEILRPIDELGRRRRAASAATTQSKGGSVLAMMMSSGCASRIIALQAER